MYVFSNLSPFRAISRAFYVLRSFRLKGHQNLTNGQNENLEFGYNGGPNDDETKYDFEAPSDDEYSGESDIWSEERYWIDYGGAYMLHRNKPKHAFDVSVFGNDVDFTGTSIWKEGRHPASILIRGCSSSLKSETSRKDQSQEDHALPTQILDRISRQVISEHEDGNMMAIVRCQSLAYRLYDQKIQPNLPCLKMCNPKQVNDSFILKVSIKSLQFYEHPMSSKEAILCQNLTRNFSYYRLIVNRNIHQFSIAAFENIVQAIIDFLNEDNSSECCKQLHTKVELAGKLLNNTFKIFSRYYENRTMLQNVMTSILESWDELQALRNQQGYQINPVMMKMSPKDGICESKSNELKIHQSMRELVPKLYQALNQYEDKIEKRDDCRDKALRFNSLSYVDKVEKLNVILDNIISNYHIVDLSHGATFELVEVPEMLRPDQVRKIDVKGRKRVSHQKYIAKIVIDDRVVATSKPCLMNYSDLSVTFDEVFCHTLSIMPKKISIQICQPLFTSMLGEKTICNVYIKVPQHVLPTELKCPLSEFACINNNARISGALRASAIWMTSLPESSLSLSVTEKEMKYFGKSQRIGSIPPIATAYNSMISDCKSCILYSKMKEVLFTFEDPSIGVVTESEINQFHDEMTCAESCRTYNNEQHLLEQLSTKSLLNRRNVTREILLEMIKKIQASRDICDQNKFFEADISWNDIVSENPIPNPFKQFRWSILPSRQRLFRSKDHPPHNIFPKRAKHRLIVSIVEACNIPNRAICFSKEYPRPTFEGENDEEYATSTFVRVHFQKSFQRTSIQQGANPVWMNTFEFPIDVEDFSPAKLLQIKENLEIEIFDEILCDTKSVGGYYEDEPDAFTEHILVAQTSIPFTAICQERLIDQYIQLETPAFHFSHELLDENSVNSLEGTNDDIVEHLEEGAPSEYIPKRISSGTYLKVVVSIEPFFSGQPRKSLKILNSIDDEPLLDFVGKWEKKLQDYATQHRNMYSKISYMDINGRFWMIPRLLRAQKPPEEINTVSRCVHFVSLVPLIDDFFENRDNHFENFFLTSQQVLDIKAGGRADHAIMLANFFLFLSESSSTFKAEVYLALGYDLTSGETIYVVRKELNTNSIILYEPVIGRAYEQGDESCPLKQINFLVQQTNIHANLNLTRKPHLLNFNLDSNNWWSLHNNMTLPPLQTPIQEGKLIFDQSNNDLVDEIEDDLSESLRREIRRCRRKPTSFLTDIMTQTKLQLCLHQLEVNRLDCSDQAQKSSMSFIKKSLNKVTKDKKVFGQPMHFVFTNIKDIIDQIMKKGLQKMKHPDAEFSVTAKVFPYSGNIFSIWVCIMVVIPS